MTNDKQMKYITDRACYNVLIDFKCAVIIDPATFKMRTITKTLKKEIENTMNIQERFGIMVPYVKINTFNLHISETVEEQPDNILTVYADCNTEMCYEDCEDKPLLSSASIIEGFFHSMGSDKEFIKSATAFDICVNSPIKGYIQADNTLYFPHKL
jgi:hypothetical protein